MNKDLKQLLEGLDNDNDRHWTVKGLPNVKHLSAVLMRNVARDEIPGNYQRGAFPAVDLGAGLGPSAPDTPSQMEPQSRSVEISAYREVINLLDDAAAAFGAIPVQRQDPELKGVLNNFHACRPAALERLERVKKREEG